MSPTRASGFLADFAFFAYILCMANAIFVGFIKDTGADTPWKRLVDPHAHLVLVPTTVFIPHLRITVDPCQFIRVVNSLNPTCGFPTTSM